MRYNRRSLSSKYVCVCARAWCTCYQGRIQKTLRTCHVSVVLIPHHSIEYQKDAVWTQMAPWTYLMKLVRGRNVLTNVPTETRDRLTIYSITSPFEIYEAKRCHCDSKSRNTRQVIVLLQGNAEKDSRSSGSRSASVKRPMGWRWPSLVGEAKVWEICSFQLGSIPSEKLFRKWVRPIRRTGTMSCLLQTSIDATSKSSCLRSEPRSCEWGCGPPAARSRSARSPIIIIIIIITIVIISSSSSSSLLLLLSSSLSSLSLSSVALLSVSLLSS